MEAFFLVEHSYPLTTTMITLKTCELDPLDRLVAVYEIRHTDVTGDTLTMEATIIGESDGAEATLTIGPCMGQDIEESLELLAEQCERAAAAIRARGRVRHSLPIFDSNFDSAENFRE